jgi:hypothetical protein
MWVLKAHPRKKGLVALCFYSGVLDFQLKMGVGGVGVKFKLPDGLFPHQNLLFWFTLRGRGMGIF